MGSEDLAGLQMGLGIRVRLVLEGKHTSRSAERAPLASLAFMLVDCNCFQLCFCVCLFLQTTCLGFGWFLKERREGLTAFLLLLPLVNL